MWTPGTQPSAILWDLDGTLIDSSPGIFHSIQATFDALDAVAPDQSEFPKFVGPPLRIGFELLGMPTELIDTAMTTYRAQYRAEGISKYSLHDAAVRMLRSAASVGIPNMIATAKTEEFSQIICDASGIAKHLAGGTDGVTGHIPGDETREHKTDIIAAAMARYGLSGSQPVVMIGDRHHDITGAADHNLAGVGVLWGFGSRDELTDAGCAAVVATEAELQHTLGLPNIV